ncbi:MAG: cell division protein ZapA [Stellaceae bacterium]
MAQVTIILNGRDYVVGCGPGEEARIRDLARGVDQRVKDLVGQLGQIGESRLLVMALLTMADELSEGHGGADGNVQAENVHPGNGHDRAGLAEGIGALAQRIAAVADRLEATKI